MAKFSFFSALHSAALKVIVVKVLAATKVVADETASEASAALPEYAPVIQFGDKLGDSFIDKVTAKVQHLEDNQEAGAAAAAAVVEGAPVTLAPAPETPAS